MMITDVPRQRQLVTAEKEVDLPDSMFLSTKSLSDVNSQIVERVVTRPANMLPPRNSISNSNRCVFEKRVNGLRVLDLYLMTINFCCLLIWRTEARILTRLKVSPRILVGQWQRMTVTLTTVTHTETEKPGQCPDDLFKQLQASDRLRVKVATC